MSITILPQNGKSCIRQNRHIKNPTGNRCEVLVKQGACNAKTIHLTLLRGCHNKLHRRRRHHTSCQQTFAQPFAFSRLHCCYLQLEVVIFCLQSKQPLALLKQKCLGITQSLHSKRFQVFELQSCCVH